MDKVIRSLVEDELIERPVIGCCIQDVSWIDKAIDSGIREDHFNDMLRREIWKSMVALRVMGEKYIDLSVLLIRSNWSPENKQSMVMELIECEKTVGIADVVGHVAIDKMVWRWKSDHVVPTLLGIKDKIDGGADRDEIIKDIESLPAMVVDQGGKRRDIKEICDEAEKWGEAQIAGTDSKIIEVTTGIQIFDRFATHIQPYEYVLVCARTSHGKTSFMEGMVGHNLRRGLKIAYFTIESSDRSVIQQIASQYSSVNLRFLRGEVYQKQRSYFEALKELREKPLLVFDRETQLEQIQAKCRMLASSFKPDVVFLDYINIIGYKANGSYEKMSALSEQMIPLRKLLGCALIVGAQLNRGNEKDDRRPERTDLRDSGSLEEDAHRIIALYRPTKDRKGMEQTLGQSIYDYELLQLKLRDGPCAACDIKFSAPYTKFYEENTLAPVGGNIK